MTADHPAPTPLYRIYRGASALLAPLAWASVSRKLRAHGVPPERMQERLGHASLDRPLGRLIWFHAASVGESLSVLTLIHRMGERLPDAEFLITSGTATSAEMIAKRMPPRCRHQFAPLDAAGPLTRFYDHWRPDAGIFVESEIWPNMLVIGRSRGVKLALLNARLSAKSVQGWRKWPDTARFVLGCFSVLIAQTRQTADDLIAMGADPARTDVGGNLKSAAAPPPVDANTLAGMRAALGDRPVWIGSSTHQGEEQAVLDAHRRLLETRPDLCLLLAPRHPERGDEVEALVRDAGFALARRSRGEMPGADTQVYLADTMGETGTWYALAPIVFLGASLVPKGGHNPFEPAMSGCALACGPHRDNAADAYAGLASAGGVALVTNGAELARQVTLWFDDPAALAAARDAARSFARAQGAAVDAVADRLCAALGLEPEG